MEEHIPPGGNWKNIPLEIKSKRLDRIRETGGRTTYYGRLVWDEPAYTITTYYHRLPNSSNLHPEQHRMISQREAARLQSFPDSFIFTGPKSAMRKQVGNAVPPLMARAVAREISKFLKTPTFVDLFAGVGGMSIGFEMADLKHLAALELDEQLFQPNIDYHQKYESDFVLGDITQEETKSKLYESVGNRELGVIIGGPPCQGFSNAGWRDPNDERNTLFKEFHGVVGKLQPEFFVMENVPGILTMRNGKVIKEIRDYFSEIGYHVYEPMKLRAEAYGVPQKRRRVFIIGSRNKVQMDIPEVLFGKDDIFLPEPVTVREAIGNLPTLGLKDGSSEIEFDIEEPTAYDLLMQEKISFDEFYQSHITELKASA